MKSEPNSEHLQLAAEAVEKLIGVYPSITASDPKIYATGMVQLFSRYPEHLIAEAVDPINGLPSLYDFNPTLKQAKEFLEPRYLNFCRMQEIKERQNRARLPAPPRDFEADAKIRNSFQKLKLELAGVVGRKQ